jgi:tetratricopeptide (TPR) repeat protein
MNLGIVQAQLEEYAAAEDSYKNSITLRKDFYPDAHFNLGTLYLKFKNKKSLALFEFTKAIDQNENHFSAWSNKIILLDELGRLDEALESTERAKILFPEKAEFYFHLGNIFGKYGQYNKAETNYQEAIQILDETSRSVSNHIQSLYRSNLGVLYHRWKKPENAIKQYEEALQYDPNNLNAKDNLKRLRK